MTVSTAPTTPLIGDLDPAEYSLDKTYATQDAAIAKAQQTAPVVAGVAKSTAPVVAGTATASTADATTRKVGANELSGTRLAALTSTEGPLMVRARQEGLLRAGARGLQNSSLAAGSAMGAMVDRAAPLAMQEAETFGRTASENMAARNAASLKNAELLTGVSVSNAGYKTQANVATARNTTDTNVANAGYLTEANSATARNTTDVNTSNARLAADANLQNAREANQASRDEFVFNGQRYLTDTRYQNELLQQKLGSDYQIKLQGILGEQAKDLLQMEGDQKLIIANTQAGAAMYSSYITAVGEVMKNEEMTPEAAATKLTMLKTAWEGGMKVLGTITGSDFSDLIPGGSSGTSGGSTTPGTPGGATATGGLLGGYADLVKGSILPEDFNVSGYLAAYPDVKQGFDSQSSPRGTLEQFAAYHYLKFGALENRTYAGSGAQK